MRDVGRFETQRSQNTLHDPKTNRSSNSPSPKHLFAHRSLFQAARESTTKMRGILDIVRRHVPLDNGLWYRTICHDSWDENSHLQHCSHGCCVQNRLHPEHLCCWRGRARAEKEAQGIGQAKEGRHQSDCIAIVLPHAHSMQLELSIPIGPQHGIPDSGL